MLNKITLLFLIFNQFIFSQTGALSGTVTLDGEKALGATVKVVNTNKGTITDSRGDFVLLKLPTGKHLVQFSYVGATVIYKTVEIKPNMTESIMVNLVSNTTLNEVIVSVPGSKLQKDLVVNVDKKNLSDINKASSSTLAESISNINGVSQNSTGSSIGKPVIRGLTSNRVVTYSQGTRVENQQWGAEHGLGISSTGIKSVEVIKGPASLLYGSDAIGGVLYFVDEDFTKKQVEGVVETGYFTNARTIQSRAGVKLGLGNFKINAFAGYTLAGDYELSNDSNFDGDRVFNTRFSERSAKLALGYEKNNVSSKLTYSFLNNFFGIPVPFDGNPIFTDRFDTDVIFPIFEGQERNFVLPFQDVTQQILTSETNIKLANKNQTNLSLTIGYATNDRQELGETRTDPDLYLFLESFNYNLKISDLIKTSKLNVTVGAQGLFQDTENRRRITLLIPDNTGVENGVYGLVNYKVNTNLRFQSGLRFDSKRVEAEGEIIDENTSFADFDDTYNTLNYSVGVKYDWSDFTFRLNVASGYRAPNVSELLSNGEHGGTGRIEIGDPDLESESATQFDFSVNYKAGDLNITANPFLNIISDYIFIAPTGERGVGNLPVFAYLQENATLFGGEFNLNYTPNYFPKLTLQTGAALTYGNDDDGDPLPFIPPVNFNSRVTYNLNIGKQLQLNTIYIQQQNFLEQNRIAAEELANDDYHLFDLGFSISYKKLSFNVIAKNIFDQEYTDHLSRLKTTFDNLVVPNPGRDIVFNLKYNF